jgi:hypothetical protein
MTTESNSNSGTMMCEVTETETSNVEPNFGTTGYCYGMSVTVNTLVADRCRSESVCQFGTCQKRVTQNFSKPDPHRACCRHHEICLAFRSVRRLCLVCGEPVAEDSFICENPVCREISLTKRQKFAPVEQMYRDAMMDA